MRKPISEVVKSKSTGKFFYLNDGDDDFGVYESGTYESGESRAIYLSSCSTKEEAITLTDKLNSGELTREKLWEQARNDAAARNHAEEMALDRLDFLKELDGDY
ncbi:hypothetical protein CMI43_03045 [Candidatus Pacearchaeota archaeon]|jgi:hypothetical protein|nr:hypothetical protein [Candidatus Pacearchaeota archaeon]|tara:strand:+ start:1644 stop:1955 length:312 start_codon:yes stop_codon:yes gene_type:complete